MAETPRSGSTPACAAAPEHVNREGVVASARRPRSCRRASGRPGRRLGGPAAGSTSSALAPRWPTSSPQVHDDLERRPAPRLQTSSTRTCAISSRAATLALASAPRTVSPTDRNTPSATRGWTPRHGMTRSMCDVNSSGSSVSSPASLAITLPQSGPVASSDASQPRACSSPTSEPRQRALAIVTANRLRQSDERTNEPVAIQPQSWVR